MRILFLVLGLLGASACLSSVDEQGAPLTDESGSGGSAGGVAGGGAGGSAGGSACGGGAGSTTTAETTCPSSAFAPVTACTGDAVCTYGTETCCGVTHPSIVCRCEGGQWGCGYTDACFSRSCHDETAIDAGVAADGG